MGLNKVYVGDEAYCKRGVLSVTCPIQCGITNSWDDMGNIWSHTFHNELRVAPEEHPVLLTLPPLAPNLPREKMAEIMFEKFNIPGVFIGVQAVLSLYASGRTTGLVVDSGDTISHVVPIYEGWEVKNDICVMNLGGGDLTDYLVQMLANKGHFFKTTSERKLVREMKERLSYVPLDFQQEVAAISCSYKKDYKLPDGQFVSLGTELSQCPEPMFQPNLLGMDSPGIHKLNINVLPIQNWISELSSIETVLAGGNTMYPGIEQRLFNDITMLTPQKMRLKIDAPKDRHYSSWVGGVCLADLEFFHEIYLKRSEYENGGVSIIHKKLY